MGLIMANTDTPWDGFKSERELLISVVGHEYGEKPDERVEEISRGREAHADRISKWLNLNSQDRVIDLGSGVGFIAQHVAPRVNHLF